MKLLIIVDYQNDFVNGSLGFPGAEMLDEKIAEIIPSYDAIIYTLDTHNENYMETVEGRNLPVSHCIKGTKGHEVYGKTKEHLGDALAVFEKETFPSLDLANYLYSHPFDEVDLCGLVSHICVLSNAIMVKAALPNSKIAVLKNLTDSYDHSLQEKTFDILRSIQIEVK